MPKLTFKERLIAGLLALGWRQDNSDRSRYTAFVNHGAPKLFVGENGALRMGECASRSHSVGDPNRQTKFYTQVLEAGTPKEVELE